MNEFAIYPFDYMRITQSHNEGNHIPHWKNVTNYSDKPWDEGCQDTGRSYFIPQNDYRVVEIKGLNTTSVTNSVRLETVNKVIIPYQSEPVILEITLTHMAEEDIQKLKVGQIIKKGTKILREGKDGATAYHFHCTANIGTYYGMKCNNNNKWVFCYEKSLLPNEAFYIDETFTKILDNKSYAFKKVSSTIKKGESSSEIESINSFLADKVKGNYYGDYTEACVSVYKKKKGFKNTDGSFIDNETLEAMKKDGLNL